MKPQGFSSSRPSQSSNVGGGVSSSGNVTQKQQPQHSSQAARHASVGSSGGGHHHHKQSHQNHHSQHQLQQHQQQHHAVLTPVQQKFSSNLLNTGSGAAINNYLSSGGRVVQAEINKAGTTSPADLLFMNQFNRTNLKKSEVKQLQKYCELNGLDFNSIYSQQQHQTQPMSKSLSKERSSGVKAATGTASQQLNLHPAQNAQQQQQQYFLQQHQQPLKSHHHHPGGTVSSKSQSHRPNQKSYQQQQQPQLSQQMTPQPSLGQNSQYSQQQTAVITVHHHHYSNNSLNQGPATAHHHPMLHNSSSVSAMLVDQSPLSTNAASANAKTASSSHAKISIHHPMMPSQMSYNTEMVMHPHGSGGADHHAAQQIVAQQQHQQAQNVSQQNFSASNGYFSQKTSPMGRLSVSGAAGASPDHHISNKNPTNVVVGPGGPKSNKVIRQPHVTGPATSKAKSSHLHGNTSQKDLNAAYQAVNQKRSGLNQQQSQHLHQGSVSGGVSGGGHHTNSNSSLEKSNQKYHHHQQIDSGVGVISGGQSSLNPRKDGTAGFHRGIQVEMKTAMQSRRKHGSIDTYKQNTNHPSGGQIRQGQGEIVQQQRVNVKNNSIFAKGVTANAANGNNQLPKVIRSQNNKAGGGGASSRPSERMMQQAHQQVSSTPSLNNSPQKLPARRTANSPSDELRYQQSSNYTNAVRQSALSRGSIKQSSQQALSGSNQMNLSLSQNSSRGLGAAGGHKSHKDASVEQMQERRIAYEASQGKMQQQQQLSASVSNLRQSTSTAKSGSNEMLLAYSQQQQQQKAAFAAAQSSVAQQLQQADDLINQQVPNIVLQQQIHVKQGTAHHGNSQRHSRIRTKSNHGSLERISNDHQALKPGSSSKRGAITAAQNSPRQALSQLKSKQPRIPDHNQDVERYYNSSRVGNQQQPSSSSKALNDHSLQNSNNNGSQYLAKAMKAQSSSLMSKTPQPPSNQDFHTVQNPGAQQPHHLLRHQEVRDYILAKNTPFQHVIQEFQDEVIEPGASAGLDHSNHEQRRSSVDRSYTEQNSDQLGNVNANACSAPLIRVSNQIGQSQIDQQQQYQHQKIAYAAQQHPQQVQQQQAPSSSSQQKKSTLLQMQQKQQQQHQHQHSLNLSHSNVNTSGISIGHPQHHQNNTTLKQATTKTSAQTVSTAKGIAHPKFLQYAASKQSTANSGANSTNTSAINNNSSSLKLKKSGTSLVHHGVGAHPHPSHQHAQHQHHQAQNTNTSQSNLIMHQHASKRSSSQEIVIQHKQSQQPQQTVKIHPVGQINDIQGTSDLYQQQQRHQQQANIGVGVGAHTSNKQRLKQTGGGHNKGEKRSSSQPTSIVTSTTNTDMSQAKYLPKHYNNDQDKKQHVRAQYYQNRRLSDDPVVKQQQSRQQIAMRTSQKSIQQQHQQSRSSINERGEQRAAGGAKQVHNAGVGKNNEAQNKMMMLNSSNIDYQSVRVSIAANENSKLVQKGGGAHAMAKKASVQEDPQHSIAKRLRKQSSVPHLHPQQAPQSSQQQNNVVTGTGAVSGHHHHHQHNRSELSKSSKQSSANMRKSQSNGPGRPQYSVNQPNAIARPETMVTDVDARRLITEDDEQEIRQVASDINEQAFYGKIIRTKKAIKNESEFNKLSPRSQEIGYVMQKVERAFTLTQQPPITDITFYRIGKMLGRGAFGKVNLAMHKLVRKLVALKSLNKEALTDEVQKAKLMKEVNLLLKLRHNHVVKIYETIETQKHIIIVMELCAGGDLLNYVRKRRRLKEPFAQKIFRQIIDGLSYIHSKNIAHRDIKLDNILLDGKGNVKIADFGVSRQIQPDQIMREQCGTPAYIAPEILRNRGYSLNVDLWSAGVVLFAMLYGTVPFKAQTMDELHQLILKGKYLLKEDISIEARDLLRGLLEINPKRRISIRKIYKHPWLRSMDPSVQLFNDEERKMIKKEYTYNDGSRYNRNENEEPVDCFTQHNLESQYSTLKNQESKSIILAPFNSTMSEQSPERQAETRSQLMELMEVKQQVLRFSKKCREIDRQYEFNNNGQLDNGVYHKVVANNSFEQQDKFEETQGIEIEQSLHDSLRNQNRKAGKSASNARNNNQISASEQSSFLSMAEDYNIQNNQPKPLDPTKVQKLVSFGYPENYVIDQMREMHANYCTAGYYLLEMDQNYC